MRLGFAAAVCVVGLVAFFRHDIWELVNTEQKDTFASKFLERRRIQSLYSPEQTEEYRDSYTENILYKRGYFEVKTNSTTIQKWTLKLNDLALLRSMGLSEEDVVRYVALETNLVQRLGTLRNSIDAVYLNEGLERMRTAEAEGVAEITSALKNEANFRKIRALEKSFIEGLK